MLDGDPANVRYAALLASAELARGRLDEALDAAERVTTAAGESSAAARNTAVRTALYVQGDVRRRRGELDTARELFSAVRQASRTGEAADYGAVLDALAAEGIAVILEQQAEDSSDNADRQAALAAYDEHVRTAQTDWQQIRSQIGRCRMLLRLDRENDALMALDGALRLDRGLDATQLRELAERQAAKQMLSRLNAIRPHVRLAGMWNRTNQKIDQKIEQKYTSLPLRNGGFELGLAEFWGNDDPAAPIWWNQNGCRSTAALSRSEQHGGDASLHIVHQSPRSASTATNSAHAATGQTLPAEPAYYRLTLWAKAERLGDDALRVLVDGVEQPVVALPAGSYDWRELRGEFLFKGDRSPTGPGDLKLQIVSQAPGECWLDDLRVERIGPVLQAN
jgi:hypothetical protein